VSNGDVKSSKKRLHQRVPPRKVGWRRRKARKRKEKINARVNLGRVEKEEEGKNGFNA